MTYFTNNNPIANARMFAFEAHGHQMYAEYPYYVHLHAVENILRRYRVDDVETLQAGLLHDTMEDTNVTYEDLVVNFGNVVADTVRAVTSPPNLPRKVRFVSVYKNIRNAGHRALLVKLADRLSHLEFGGEKVGMYVKEHPSFVEGIYQTGDIQGEFAGSIYLLQTDLNILVESLARKMK